MSLKRRAIEKVRASRDGHEFHEAWAARRALSLVFPKDGLNAIAVEGLSIEDQKTASAEAAEIADLTFYYGPGPSFARAKKVVVAQLKYSIRSSTKAFRSIDGRKTFRKFAAAFRDYKKRHGARKVESKLEFELVTNRPVHPDLSAAIKGLALGRHLNKGAKNQGNQIRSASGLKGKELIAFAAKLKVTGLAGSLRENKLQLSRAVVDWSAARDAMARSRLGALRALLRDKAGSAGQGNNLIRRTDVLDALELQSPDELLPCPESFPNVGKIIAREQLKGALKLIPRLKKPLVIHAAGGMGKTVFVQSLAKALSNNFGILLFDCFGGGAYRAPEDARHLPKRGLIHIVNNLACDGLCDPLLPNNESVQELVKAFRVRLEQAVTTLRRGSRDRQILLFIDAIDNAAEHAKDKGEAAFPTVLLESLYHNGPINGVQLILSCRSHRKATALGGLPCEELELKPFTIGEVGAYLRSRIQSVTATQIQVAFNSFTRQSTDIGTSNRRKRPSRFLGTRAGD